VDKSGRTPGGWRRGRRVGAVGERLIARWTLFRLGAGNFLFQISKAAAITPAARRMSRANDATSFNSWSPSLFGNQQDAL
jgi:hypothetical protein